MNTKLPWNFEAFRKFITFEVLQQSASTLLLYDGVDYSRESEKSRLLSQFLSDRTDLEWVPERQVAEGINFDVEGSVFRNKARVFTSFFILDPIAIQERSQIIVSPFGRALGTGLLSREDFYEESVFRFQYPHPAYEDNWSRWTSAQKSLYPLLYIIQILIELTIENEAENYLEVSELATYGFEDADNSNVSQIASCIISSRGAAERNQRDRSDDVNRKIGDMFGFLCITGKCFYGKKGISLNLIGVSTEDKCHFWNKRGKDSVLITWKQLIRQRLGF